MALAFFWQHLLDPSNLLLISCVTATEKQRPACNLSGAVRRTYSRGTRAMVQPEPDTEQLLDRLAAGDTSARDPLLQRHRERLRQMIVLRLDRRLRARVDPSDVIQETQEEAIRKLAEYVRDRPLPFYPWLRELALEQIVRLHRWHIGTGKRSVAREAGGLPLPDESAAQLAGRLAKGSSPSARLMRAELRDRVRAALAQLNNNDREVLVLRYLEHLRTAEIAAVLGLAESGVKARQLRALRRLRDLLGDDLAEEMS
jgi:RNA polymerase sigma-70 factor (ECF subfamily)